MKFTAQAGDLAALLGHVKRSVPARTTIPVLQHVEMIAHGGKVRVRGTNLDVECWGFVDADVEETGKAAIPGIALQSIVSRLKKDAPLIVSMSGDRCTLACGRARYDLSTHPLDGFPSTRQPHEAERASISVAPASLNWLIGVTRGSIAPPKSGYAMAEGLFLKLIDGKLYAVASNGKQIVAAHIEAEGDDFPDVTVIPSLMAGELQSLATGDDPVTIIADARRIMFDGPSGTATSSLLDSRFFDWRRFMPERGDPIAVASAEDLVPALDRAMLAYTGLDVKAPTIDVSVIDGAIAIETEKNKQHDGHEEIDAEAMQVGAAFKCDGRFLKSLLALWGEARVALQLFEGNNDTRLTIWSEDDPRMQQVLMLMRR